MSNQKNILVTGANGQLGMEIRVLAKEYPGYSFFFTDRDELSIIDPGAIEKYFQQNNFYYCINCAAYTAVDKAETDADDAFAINATGAGWLATFCKKNDTQFIHISTDYVFDGNGASPYKESDQPNPVSVYGSSKLKGEVEVVKNNDQSIIIRTSWVYSSYGNNFVKTMLRLMSERESIAVVNDQFGSPTYAADLAAVILKIMLTGQKHVAGIYNYCNEGSTSWYEFALEIKKIIGSKCIVNPIETAAYPTLAKRPQYSVLDTSRIRSAFNIQIPLWKESLKKCILLLRS